MKPFALACVLMLTALAAHAGTQTLPEPSLAQITGISNLGSETPNDITTTHGRQAITGWSQDGKTLTGMTTGVWTYGYRGSRAVYWCGTLTWTITVDPVTGELNTIAPATFTAQGPQGKSFCQGYQQWNSGATLYNSKNYGANAAPQQPIGDSGPINIATLLTP